MIHPEPESPHISSSRRRVRVAGRWQMLWRSCPACRETADYRSGEATVAEHARRTLSCEPPSGGCDKGGALGMPQRGMIDRQAGTQVSGQRCSQVAR